MLVKPIKEIIATTAEQLGLPERLVEGVVKYYFWWVYKQLDEINYPSIHLPNIGTFYMAKVNYMNALNFWLKKLRANPHNKEYCTRKFKILWKGRHVMRRYYEIKKRRSPIYGKNPKYYESWSSGGEGSSD